MCPFASTGGSSTSKVLGSPAFALRARSRHIRGVGIPMFPRYKRQPLSTVSDADGNFKFSGARGRFFNFPISRTNSLEFEHLVAGTPSTFIYPNDPSGANFPPSSPDKRLVLKVLPAGTSRRREQLVRAEQREAQRVKHNQALDREERARRDAREGADRNLETAGPGRPSHPQSSPSESK